MILYNVPTEIKSALIQDIKLIDVNGFSNTCLYTAADSSVRNRIHKNRVPILLLAGRYDKAFIPLLEYAKANFSCLKRQELNGGHSINLDQPKQFNRFVMKFMKSHTQME